MPALLADGKFPNGFEHYRAVGFLEFRHSGFSGWDEQGYLIAYGDVRKRSSAGVFGRDLDTSFKYGDVRNGVIKAGFQSGIEHFLKAGAREGRKVALGLVTPH